MGPAGFGTHFLVLSLQGSPAFIQTIAPHNLVFYCAVQRVGRGGLAECTGMQTLLFEMQPDHALHTSCASSDACVCVCVTGTFYVFAGCLFPGFPLKIYSFAILS